MKPSLMRKVSGLLATMLLVSAMLPIIALASNVFFKNVVYQNGTVSGQVYVSKSVYGDVYGNAFELSFLSNTGATTVGKATYTSSDNTYSYYNFNVAVTGATYLDYRAFQTSAISVNNGVYEYQSVTQRVYDSTPRGGGGGFFPPVAGGNTNISASQISNAFANGKTEVTFEINGTSATLPASALVNAPEGAVVTIKNATGSYSLPVDTIDFEALADELGVAVNALDIVVTIAEVTGETAEELSEAAGGTDAAAVEFSVEAKAGNETVAITDFGSTYVERTINVDADASATGVLYDPATGTFSFIPATFADGVATLKSTTNSIYAVLELDNSFADVDGHWAQSYVETLANKLIVEGYEDGSFGPDGEITRAEFATLVVRALGLNGKAAPDAPFSDVSTSDWFEGAVALAADAGIVNGFEDGTFRPNEVITREQLAAMVVRASAFAGTDLSVEASAEVLAAFSDADSIVWADAEIAAAVEAGIVEGYEDGTFRAGNTATRAEASTMINRFLVNADFINE
jgi:hypothetical protein